jgi:hypothetical protein
VLNLEFITVTWPPKTPGTAQAQEEEIMLKKLIPLFFLALALVGVPLAGLAQATFRQYTHVSDSGGTNVGFITSPAITLSAGDFVLVSCRTGNGLATSIAVTSSPSNAFKQLAVQAGGPGSQQSSYAVNVRSGSTTFTCTPNAPSPYQSMIVLDYGVSPNTVFLDKQAGSTTPSKPTYTSPAFSTSSSAAELMILCGTVGGGNNIFTAGSFGPLKTTLRGVSASSLKSNADMACEDAIAPTRQASIWGRIAYGSSQPWAATVGAFLLEAPAKSSPKVR